MLVVDVQEVRKNLDRLLSKVSRGEEIIITCHGKKTACLVPFKKVGQLPSLRKFRDSIKVSGKPMNEDVLGARNQERF